MRRQLLLISTKTSSHFGMMSNYPGVQRRVGTQRGVGVQEGIMKGVGFELSLEKWFVFSQVEKRRCLPKRRDEQNGSPAAFTKTFPPKASFLLSIN